MTNTSSKNDHYNEEEDEAPRLSFCDLPLYSSSSDASSDSKEEYMSSCSKEDEENFLFDLIFSSGFTPPDNIIFCGKQMIHNVSNDNDEAKPKNSLKKKVFHWMARSSIFSRPKAKVVAESSPKQQQGKKKEVLKPSTSWRMMMCGSMRVPNEMDLGDIKTRQKRQQHETKAFVAMFEDHEQQRSKLGMGMRMGMGRSTSVNCLIGA